MGTAAHIRAVLLLPVTVTIGIPGLLLYFLGWDTFSLWDRTPVLRIILPAVGLLFIGVGVGLMISTIRLFATVGKGTLAPWDPTQKLVVQGVYRHVRNPMISGVFCILIGETLALASLALLIWSAIFISGNAVYMPLVEEPGLLKRFGADYEEYRRNVPRWLPRRRPWQPG